MRKCCLLLLLPVVLGTRSPAAVFEDVFELGRPAIAYLTTPENQNGMHAYLTKRNRQMAEPQGMVMSASSYAWASPAANERYQSFEETQYDRIRMENLKRIASVRTKRLDALAHPPPPPPAKKARGQQLRKPKQVNIVPREVFKFTLEDAMVHPKVESSSKNKRRVKRELGVDRVPKRLEPVPREILWFEAKDAITQSPQEGQGAIHQRRKRSADPGNNEGLDVVSFQLQDAKTADRDSGLFNKQLIEENPNLRMPFMTSDNFKRGSVFDEIVERPEPRKRERKKEKRENQSDDSDLNIEESRRVKVRGGKKKLANYEDLPLGVQKAIDIAIQENERMNGKISEEPPRSPPKYYFGDKKPKTKKPFSSTTSAKPSFPSSPKESKFAPSPPIETGFVPSKPMSSQDSSENIKPEKSSPGAWWPVSNLNRSKRLQQKATYPPLVVSPQYVHTYKPTMESYKMKELSQSYEQSQSYEHSHENSYEIPESSKEYHQEKPKIKYVIKEIPVPVRMKESRTKITVQPTISISYDKEPTGSGSSSESDSKDYNNPYGPVELRYEQPKESPKSFANLKIVVPDSKEQSESSYYDDNHVVEHPNPTEASHSSESYEKTGSSIAALSALIGKRPTIQLKGLNDLLGMPIPIGNQQPLQKLKTRVRPQDNTAPILFPGESSTPTPPPAKKMPGYRSVQIENGPKILYEDNSSPSTLYHTVQMNPQLKVPMTKDYTPIKEVVSDIADSDLIGPTIATPTHATYIISSSSTPVPPTAESEHSYESSGDISNQESASYLQEVHSTPETIVEPISVQYQTRQVNYKQHQHQHHVKHYEEHEEDEHEHAAHHKYHGHHFDHPHSDHHHHHDDDEHSEDYDDAEGYAFGYRVRDFHTGNDFGHIQNRDNGVTRGEYHILLPDGRVQNVRYHADEKGFHAEVSYESVHGSSSESSSSSSSK